MVVEGSGTATHWSATGRAAPLKSGDIVAAGDSVETGPDGRWVLQRRGHADSVTVSSRSRFMIPAPAAKGMLADIIQSMGTLFFNVEHTPGRRFEVDGPYLAAVVKGTSFTIAVSPSESTVNVLQGAVEVQSTGTLRLCCSGLGNSRRCRLSGDTSSRAGRDRVPQFRRRKAPAYPRLKIRGRAASSSWKRSAKHTSMLGRSLTIS
jgi:hypothetical protein